MVNNQICCCLPCFNTVVGGKQSNLFFLPCLITVVGVNNQFCCCLPCLRTVVGDKQSNFLLFAMSHNCGWGKQSNFGLFFTCLRTVVGGKQ